MRSKAIAAPRKRTAPTIPGTIRRRISLTGIEARAAIFGALWLVTWFGLTVFLPARSSLYALPPSLGSALVSGAVASAAFRLAPDRFRRLAAALIVLAFVAIPIYRSRNMRWVGAADLAARTIATLQREVDSRPPDGTIILIDDPATRFNFRSAFGSLFPDAVSFWIGRGWTGDLVDDIALARPPFDRATLNLKLQARDLTLIPTAGR